jgi:hypothetical protein
MTEPFDKSNARHHISQQYARWCAFSATRSGAPQKSREVVYPLIDVPAYDEILVGNEEITEAAFDSWHQENSERICQQNAQWTTGWATKLINVYLKTLVYVGQIGRPGLVAHIHPPIDGGLWDGVARRYEPNSEIIQQTHFKRRIKHIADYNTYKTIIAGMKLIRTKENWKLIEVEQLWEAPNF